MRKNDQRIRLTKMLIRRAFLDLLRTKPMQGISIKELCTAAGINRGTFYSHYADIYDLLEQIEDDMMHDFQEALKPLLDSGEKKLTPLKITTGIFQ